jgi:hypothetical protein
VNSEPYIVVDLITRFRSPYKIGPGYLEPFLMFQNLLDTEYKQVRCLFDSQLRNEPDPVADIHFTPGAPFGVLGASDSSFEPRGGNSRRRLGKRGSSNYKAGW